MNQLTRRNMLRTSAVALAGGAAMLRGVSAARSGENATPATRPTGAALPASGPIVGDVPYTPVITPNGSTLPWKMVEGVKVFHLIAEPTRREFAPGLVVNCWGYNGQTPGPTIEAVEGDRVRIYVTNKLPEPTSVHWHGMLLPAGMDGVSGLNQKPIEPGQTFRYEFTLRQAGTLMYHSHFDEMVQMALGMTGFFIIHPRDPQQQQRVDRDFALFLAEWYVKPGSATPDPTVMEEFNLFTINSRVFPGTEPLVVKKGERVRVRFGNLSMHHHPIHLHGYHFRITGTNGGRIAPAAQVAESTVLVPVGDTRDIEFVADEPGDWALHCHMTHHTMNQMGHDAPNMIGMNPKGLDPKVRELVPGYMTMGHKGMGDMMQMKGPDNALSMKTSPGPFAAIDMGGMFTILKVRENLKSYEDPGWYEYPKGTLAEPASDDERRSLGL